MRNRKCDRCKSRKRVVFGWYGLWMCNPCIVQVGGAIQRFVNTGK